MQEIFTALERTMPMMVSTTTTTGGDDYGEAPMGNNPPYDGTPAGRDGGQSGPFHIPEFGTSGPTAQTPSINLAVLDEQIKRTAKDYVKRFVEHVAGLCEVSTTRVYTVNEFVLWKAEMHKVGTVPGYEPMQYTNPWEFIQTHCGAAQAFPLVSAMNSTWGEFEALRMSENAVLRHKVLWKAWADLTAVCCAQINVTAGRKVATHMTLQIQSRQNLMRRGNALAVLKRYRSETY